MRKNYIHICAQCGKAFNDPSHAVRKFCSRACFSEHRRITPKQLKENNHLYKATHKEESAETSRIYRAKNKERIAAYNKQYNKENKESIAATTTAYYQKHKEQIQARHLIWHRANAEKERLQSLEYSKLHRDRSRKYARTYNATHKKEKHAYMIKKKYGLSTDGYAQLLNEQGGVCAICGGINQGGKKLLVDHDHATGKVRGLLCGHCNLSLGYAHDNTHVFMAMAIYVDKHNGSWCSTPSQGVAAEWIDGTQ